MRLGSTLKMKLAADNRGPPTLPFLNAFGGRFIMDTAAGLVILHNLLLVKHLQKSKWGIWL
jgi:glucose-6-phosphate isomerase